MLSNQAWRFRQPDLRTSVRTAQFSMAERFGCFLDVGASWGRFMSVARRQYSLKGIELSGKCSAHARDVLGRGNCDGYIRASGSYWKWEHESSCTYVEAS